MSLQENIKKKIFVPPLNHSGGDILAVPPLNCSGGGQFSGGDSPPPKIAQGGGQSPILPPCIRSCIHIYVYICIYIYNIYINDKRG